MFFFFFFNDTATTEIYTVPYTLSLHDALPIWGQDLRRLELRAAQLRIAQLSLAYRGTADLSREPLPPFVNLAARRPASGWVAIFALARTRAPEDYAWLDAYQPVERVGKSIDLYYIP